MKTQQNAFQKLKSGYESLVSKGSKSLHLDLDYFVKGGFWSFISQTISATKALILSILFANLLPKELYGQYSFVLGMLAIAGCFALPGLGRILVQSIAKNYQRTYWTVVRAVFKWSWLSSLFLLVLSISGKLIGREYGALVFLILAAAQPVYWISGLYIPFLQGKKKFDTIAKFNLISTIISTSAIAAVTIWKQEVFWIVVVTVYVQIIIQVINSYIILKKYADFQTDKGVNTRDITLGKKLSFLNIFITLVQHLDAILIPSIISFSTFATYTIGLKLPQIFLNFLRNISRMYTPKLANMMDLRRVHIRKPFFLLLLASIGIVLALDIFIIPLCVSVLFPKYLEAIPYAQALSLIILTFPNDLVNSYMNIKRDFSRISKLAIAIYTFRLSCLLILTPLFEVWGVITATVAPKLLLTLINGIYIWRK